MTLRLWQNREPCAHVQAAFTFTTTHHGRVKEESQVNPAFVNAAVRFDIDTLKPTYELVWDELGASNALAVARTLGFDRKVVEQGEEWKIRLSGPQEKPSAAERIAQALKVRFDNCPTPSVTSGIPICLACCLPLTCGAASCQSCVGKHELFCK